MTIASNTALGATTNAGAQTAQAAATAGSQQLAGNFDTFLQLLTTQLQNQNPLDPLDTNQFTQQLVEFASVEQQVNMNTNLQTLISLQQTSQATSAMQLIGVTAAVKSNTAVLSNATGSPATWSFSVPSPATGQLSITNASGQTVYAGSVTLSPGNHDAVRGHGRCALAHFGCIDSRRRGRFVAESGQSRLLLSQILSGGP
jgi:flagellar basal-body rod modification protein FlgD